jgi:cytochrome c5
MTKTSTWFIPPLAIALSLALTACGKKEEPQTAAPSQPAPAAEVSKPAEPAAPVETPVADAGAVNGEKVFKSTCSMCHQTGAAGAPIIGDKADWGPRIAQGTATLHDHAIKGYTGAKGMMPAKGGNASLKDEEVKAAVDYMVSKAQ